MYLAATGMSLIWSMGLSGTLSLTIESIKSNHGSGSIAGLLDISPARWYIEAFFIDEAAVRPWAELHKGDELPLKYFKSNLGLAKLSIVAIGFAWAFVALILLKLVNRSKMK